MFGIDQVSWSGFFQVILLILVCWYLSLMLFFYVKRKDRRQKALFEDDYSGDGDRELHHVISVSSKSFPAEMIPVVLAGSIPLPVSFYEEIGLNEGYSLDQLQDVRDPLPASVIQQIQVQQ